jgi:hypothetical protein
MMSVYEGRMIVRLVPSQPLPRAAAVAVWLVLGIGLSGCAGLSDGMTSAFADPGKYSLYECKQLETERKSLAVRAADLRALMAKAETGVAGSVVAELAYRNEYLAVRGQSKFADEAWQNNKCVTGPPEGPAIPETLAAPAPSGKRVRPPARSGSGVY